VPSVRKEIKKEKKPKKEGGGKREICSLFNSLLAPLSHSTGRKKKGGLEGKKERRTVFSSFSFMTCVKTGIKKFIEKKKERKRQQFAPLTSCRPSALTVGKGIGEGNATKESIDQFLVLVRIAGLGKKRRGNQGKGEGGNHCCSLLSCWGKGKNLISSLTEGGQGKRREKRGASAASPLPGKIREGKKGSSRKKRGVVKG